MQKKLPYRSIILDILYQVLGFYLWKNFYFRCGTSAFFGNFLDTQEEGTNIRIFVVNPGTPGAECGVSYCPPNSVEATDTEMKYDTFSAFVDEISLPFLEDAEIDYVTEELVLN